MSISVYLLCVLIEWNYVYACCSTLAAVMRCRPKRADVWASRNIPRYLFFNQPCYPRRLKSQGGWAPSRSVHKSSSSVYG